MNGVATSAVMHSLGNSAPEQLSEPGMAASTMASVTPPAVLAVAGTAAGAASEAGADAAAGAASGAGAGAGAGAEAAAGAAAGATGGFPSGAGV